MSGKDTKKIKCKCPFCDTEIEEESIICSVCKVKIIHCKKCGSPVASNSKKCPSCGESIT
jgi:hypothetical protein